MSHTHTWGFGRSGSRPKALITTITRPTFVHNSGLALADRVRRAAEPAPMLRKSKIEIIKIVACINEAAFPDAILVQSY